MRLTRVVLPAPLGPIRPWMDPCSTSSDTWSTAWTPPKCRWTLSRRRSTDIPTRPPPRPDEGETAATDDALRPEHDHRDQEDSGDDVDVCLGLLEDPGQACYHQRADHGPYEVSAAAQHCEGEDLYGPRDPVLLVPRVDEEVEVRFQAAGEPGQDCAQDERDHLVARDVDALAQSSELVLPDRRPRGAEASLGQAPHDEEDHGHRRQHHVDAAQRVGGRVLEAQTLARDREVEDQAKTQRLDEPDRGDGEEHPAQA